MRSSEVYLATFTTKPIQQTTGEVRQHSGQALDISYLHISAHSSFSPKIGCVFYASIYTSTHHSPISGFHILWPYPPSSPRVTKFTSSLRYHGDVFRRDHTPHLHYSLCSHATQGNPHLISSHLTHPPHPFLSTTLHILSSQTPPNPPQSPLSNPPANPTQPSLQSFSSTSSHTPSKNPSTKTQNPSTHHHRQSPTMPETSPPVQPAPKRSDPVKNPPSPKTPEPGAPDWTARMRDELVKAWDRGTRNLDTLKERLDHLYRLEPDSYTREFVRQQLRCRGREA